VVNVPGHRPLSAGLLLIALIAPGCSRVSTLQRFGGSTVALHVENLPSGVRMDAVESSLKDVFRHRLISAELAPLDRGSGFLVQFPQNPSGPDDIRALVEVHEQRAKLLELRLAYNERTRRDLLLGTIGSQTGQPVTIYVEPNALVDGSELISARLESDRFVLRFDTRAQNVLSDARQRNPSALLAVLTNGQFVGALRQTNISQGALALAADDPRWQNELAVLAASVVPGTLRIGEVQELPSPEVDGKGSKYPW
jgi:hypothetical protein